MKKQTNDSGPKAPKSRKTRKKDFILGAAQGIMGDTLKKLGFDKNMAFYHDSQPLPLENLQIFSSHVVIFIHGNSDTENTWFSTHDHNEGYGTRLEKEYGICPLYIRYNSGLGIQISGASLAELLQELFSTFKKIKKLSIIAHSLGGLIVHNAVYHGKARSLRWPKTLRQVFVLGTPHLGSPVAKAATGAGKILGFIPNPYTLLSAGILDLRSQSLKELSNPQDYLPARNFLLSDKAIYVFVAGSLAKNEKSFLNYFFGDGLVRPASALFPANAKRSFWQKIKDVIKQTPIRVAEYAPGVGHIKLTRSEKVYEIIKRHFKA